MRNQCKCYARKMRQRTWESTNTETEMEPYTIKKKCKTDTNNWIPPKCFRGGPSFSRVGWASVHEIKPPPWGQEVRRIRNSKSEENKKGGRLRINTLDGKGRRIMPLAAAISGGTTSVQVTYKSRFFAAVGNHGACGGVSRNTRRAWRCVTHLSRLFQVPAILFLNDPRAGIARSYERPIMLPRGHWGTGSRGSG